MKRLLTLLLATLAFAAVPLSAASQSLTTLYSAGNNQSGNMFDLQATKAIKITSFDLHMSNAGSTNTVSVYWRAGSANGAESSSAGWNRLGTATVVSRGQGVATPLPIGGLVLQAGQTYGIYIINENGPAYLLYTDGSNVFSNGDLALTTWFGKGLPLFTGPTFSPRQWNGTVYYGAPFTTCAAEGYRGGQLTMCQKICESNLTGSALSGMVKLYVAAYREQPACAR